MKFRSRLILYQLLLFSALALVFWPLVHVGVKKMESKVLIAALEEIASRLDEGKDLNDVIAAINSEHGTFFYALSLYDHRGILLATTEASINEEKGLQSVATAIKIKGEILTLKGSFPLAPFKKFQQIFNYWSALVGLIAFVLFSCFSLLLLRSLHKPILRIIKAIRCYQEGHSQKMLAILDETDFSCDKDFATLAMTLKTLYIKVQSQLAMLIEARDEKEAILESLGEGVVAFDKDLVVSYINFTAAKILGSSKLNLLGHIIDVDHGLARRVVELVKLCRSAQAVATDTVAFGEPVKSFYDVIAVPRGNDMGAIVVIQDKSSQHKVLEMGKDFVANASHELRTPITIIKGFAETLEDMKDLPHDVLESIVEKIVRNCERMEVLIKNLLTLADLENLSISPYQSCDLVLLIESAIDLVKGVYTEATIDFFPAQERVMAAADANILELALVNLLTNAAKYCNGPAKIFITLLVTSREAVVCISDKGIGIPKADIGRIFDRFYTVDKAHSRKLGGAGLGLSLVKTIIEKHHGIISVDSQLGVGTTFSFTIPLTKNGEGIKGC